MKPMPDRWSSTWNALLGTTPDQQLAAIAGVTRNTVRYHRLKLGVPRVKGKQKTKCNGCRRFILRRVVRPEANTCGKCKRKNHNAQMRAKHQQNKIDDKVRPNPPWTPATLERQRAWRKKNYLKYRAYQTKYHRARRKKEREKNEALIRSLPCFTCGQKHTQELRARIIRRMLPCSARELRSAWPCIWGDSSDRGASEKAKMLTRDLQKTGAVRSGGVYDLRKTAVAC